MGKFLSWFFRNKLLLIAVAFFLLLGLFLRLYFSEGKDEVSSGVRNVSIAASVRVLPQSPDSLALAKIDVVTVNYNALPILSANETVFLKSISSTYSNSVLVNLPEGRGRNGEWVSASFVVCNQKRFQEVLNVSYLRDDAISKCILFDGAEHHTLLVTLSSAGRELAREEKEFD